MKNILLAVCMFIVPHNTFSQPTWRGFRFETGDLLFQDLDCGPLCDAIEAVTAGYKGRNFSHVGIVYVVRDSVWVVEAYGSSVRLTRLSEFMLRQTDDQGNPKVVVGRLSPDYARLNGAAVSFALKQRGRPYDEEFLSGNEKYYCSELVYHAYEAANGRPFFVLSPMSFREPLTGKIFPAWTDYYKALGSEVPDGLPGCNPGSIANDKKVEIVTYFY
jgi:hypothetical protein